MRNTDAPIQLLAHTSTFLGPWRKRALLSTALHKKSWAVIDRPYSLGCATVGALYERPRCIFCAKPILTFGVLSFLVIVITTASAWAQATAQISGSVRDQSGAVLPGVEITATQTDTGVSRMTITNEAGL